MTVEYPDGTSEDTTVQVVVTDNFLVVTKNPVSYTHLDVYKRQVEEQTEFVGVLATRDSAIIHFTEELHGVSNQARTSLIRCVLQYINPVSYTHLSTKRIFMSSMI